MARSSDAPITKSSAHDGRPDPIVLGAAGEGTRARKGGSTCRKIARSGRAESAGNRGASSLPANFGQTESSVGGAADIWAGELARRNVQRGDRHGAGPAV